MTSLDCRATTAAPIMAQYAMPLVGSPPIAPRVSLLIVIVKLIPPRARLFHPRRSS